MESLTQDSFISCQTSQGIEVRGNLLRLDRHMVVFELYSQGAVLQSSEVLSEFRIVLKERLAYSGRAVVKTLINTGLMLVCEATLHDFWIDLDVSALDSSEARLRPQFDAFFAQWQKFYKVLPEYKVIIADMQSFLVDLRLWADQLELAIRSSPSADRLLLEQEVSEEIGPPIVQAINYFFEKFEALAERIDPEQRPVHAAFMKRQLHPYVLCSPFAYRTFHKPLGFAGDYEMVNMIARSPYEGGSLFAKLMNLWFVMQPPAEAHRRRLDYLLQKSFEETVRVAGQGRMARIFNLACGPAIEVQRFLAQKDICDRAQYTLLDFNEETIQHATAALGAVKAKYRRSTELNFVKKSVHQILKESGKAIERPPDKQFDLIYCAGLFDYLSDQICHRLADILYTWLAPGALMLVTNVVPHNPLRHGMEHLLDWNLIYRNAQQLHALRPRDSLLDCVSVRSEETGINLFLEIRKPKDA